MKWHPGLHFTQEERMSEWLILSPCKCDYDYGGYRIDGTLRISFPAHNLSQKPLINEIRVKCNEVTGLHCDSGNTSFYDKNSTIPPHADDGWMFYSNDEKLDDISIASISIGT